MRRPGRVTCQGIQSKQLGASMGAETATTITEQLTTRSPSRHTTAYGRRSSRTHAAELGAKWPLNGLPDQWVLRLHAQGGERAQRLFSTHINGLLDHWVLRQIVRGGEREQIFFSTHRECTVAVCIFVCCCSCLLTWALDWRATVARAERELADARALTLAVRRGARLANDAASERAATAFTRATDAERTGHHIALRNARKLAVAERTVAGAAERIATAEHATTAAVERAWRQQLAAKHATGRAATIAWCAAEAELEKARVHMCDEERRHRAEEARLRAECEVATRRAAAAERTAAELVPAATAAPGAVPGATAPVAAATEAPVAGATAAPVAATNATPAAEPPPTCAPPPWWRAACAGPCLYWSFNTFTWRERACTAGACAKARGRAHHHRGAHCRRS
jgi:hypothetical protein